MATSSQARRSSSFAFLKIGVNPRDIWRTSARRKPRGLQAAPADGNINGLYKWLRPHCLSVDADYLGLLDGLVQVVALKPVTLGGEYHGGLPACDPKGVQHVKAVERVLDGVVVPGKVGNHYVKSQAVIDGVLDRSLILGDPYLGIHQGLSQKRFDDLAQRGSD